MDTFFTTLILPIHNHEVFHSVVLSLTLFFNLSLASLLGLFPQGFVEDDFFFKHVSLWPAEVQLSLEVSGVRQPKARIKESCLPSGKGR